MQTKEELTVYLANKIISRFTELKLHVIVAWREEVSATHITVQHLRSSHEEADTKLILHAADATLRGASTIDIHLPDTDVVILALRRYPMLCSRTSCIVGSGKKKRQIALKPIYNALGEEKIECIAWVSCLYWKRYHRSFRW